MDRTDVGKCFACGQKNPIGLKLEFYEDGDGLSARFTPRAEYQGYTGITHGGIVSTLLDEAMAKLVYEKGYMALTAELKVRFRKPAVVGEEHIVTGWIDRVAHRMIDCHAELRNSKGEVVAEAVGKMVMVE